MSSPMLDRELKKGSAELLILSLVEDRPRHRYDIGQLIELRSRGVLDSTSRRCILSFTGLKSAVGFADDG